MAGQGKKYADETFLMALACGATVESGAAKAGISPRTAHRRLLTPAFQQRLAEVKTDMVKRAAGMLTAASGEAVKTLLSLQDAKMPQAWGLAPPNRFLGLAR